MRQTTHNVAQITTTPIIPMQLRSDKRLSLQEMSAAV